MNLTGKIVKIIKPDEFEKYYEPTHGFIPGKYHLIVRKLNGPKNRVTCFFYYLFYKTDHFAHIALDFCPYEKGDLIDIEVKPYYKKTDLFIEVKDQCY